MSFLQGETCFEIKKLHRKLINFLDIYKSFRSSKSFHFLQASMSVHGYVGKSS